MYVFYVAKGSTSPDQALVYHVTSKAWGRMTKSVEAALRYVAAGTTIDGMSAVAATIDTLPSIPLDSQYWQSGGRAFSVFNTSHQIQTLTGESSASSITTGDIGDDGMFTTLKGSRVRFLNSPTSASGEAFAKNELGDDFMPMSTFTMSGSRADMLQSARWHRVRFDFTGDVEVSGVSFNTIPDGEE